MVYLGEELKFTLLTRVTTNLYALVKAFMISSCCVDNPGSSEVKVASLAILFLIQIVTLLLPNTFTSIINMFSSLFFV